LLTWSPGPRQSTPHLQRASSSAPLARSLLLPPHKPTGQPRTTTGLPHPRVAVPPPRTLPLLWPPSLGRPTPLPPDPALTRRSTPSPPTRPPPAPLPAPAPLPGCTGMLRKITLPKQRVTLPTASASSASRRDLSTPGRAPSSPTVGSGQTCSGASPTPRAGPQPTGLGPGPQPIDSSQCKLDLRDLAGQQFSKTRGLLIL
jgi:hypothetical protein